MGRNSWGSPRVLSRVYEKFLHFAGKENLGVFPRTCPHLLYAPVPSPTPQEPVGAPGMRTPGGSSACCPPLESTLRDPWGAGSLPAPGRVRLVLPPPPPSLAKHPKGRENPVEQGRASRAGTLPLGRGPHLLAGQTRQLRGQAASGQTPGTPAPCDPCARGHHEWPSRGPEPPAAGGAGQGEGLRG